MRRFSASAGGSPQSGKTSSLPFVARITPSFPTMRGSVSSPTRRQGRTPSGSSWRRHATHRRRPRTWLHRRRDIHPTHGLESQRLRRRRVESASNRWPNVLPESSSTHSQFSGALPGGTVAGGRGCLRAIGSALHQFPLIRIIQNFYNRGNRGTGQTSQLSLGAKRRRSSCLIFRPNLFEPPAQFTGEPGFDLRGDQTGAVHILNVKTVLEA